MAFVSFGYDKWCAAHSRRRVSEKTLLMLAAIGGWFGGVVGMILFRHKTAKWSFLAKYAVALVAIIVEAWAVYSVRGSGKP